MKIYLEKFQSGTICSAYIDFIPKGLTNYMEVEEQTLTDLKNEKLKWDNYKLVPNENYKEPISDTKALEIGILKSKLKNSDYKVLKYIEGQLSLEEYLIIKATRQEWRNKINELEKEE